MYGTPYICQFWYTIAPFRPVKSTPQFATKWPVWAKIDQNWPTLRGCSGCDKYWLYAYLQRKQMGVKENGKTSKKTVNNFNISQLCDHTVHHLVTFPETLFQFVLLKTLLKSKV